jgi:hypothetical protein
MNQPAHSPHMPYGVQQPHPAQVYVPVSGKRPGSTSSKVWGILLLVLGGLGLVNQVMSLGMIFGGVSGSMFMPTVDEATKREMDALMSTVIDSMLGRWTFWVNTIGEFTVAILSLVAGFFLAVRPRPSGRSMAIGRAALVLVLLVPYGLENTTALEEQFAMQQRIMERTMDEEVAKQSDGASNQEIERRRREVREMSDTMQPFMRGAGYGMMIIIVVGVLIVNGLLLFFMTRPAVKTYLEEVARDGNTAIPQFDPSMGIMVGPPGQPQPPPNPPQVPPV